MPHRYGNSRAIWIHTVLPATWQRWQAGCEAELT